MTNFWPLVIILFPIQSNQGVVFERDDMTITHEEADTWIIQQVAYVGTLSEVGD